MDNLPISILDLATIRQGFDLKNTFEVSLEMAQHAESLNFKRYWFAEHHNMASVASSATAVLIGYIAGNTERIRVGAGGIMLPNHSSLVIAEQFGTLEALYPNRIDLGLGRAPGTDMATAQALGRNAAVAADGFPRQIEELQQYFSEKNSQAPVRAIPGEGQNVPLFILGSSTDSAYLAASMGLPYAFAGHFAPMQMETAFRIYRERFSPSKSLEKPYTLAAVNILAADTTEKAQHLAKSLYQAFINILRNNRQPASPPSASAEPISLHPAEAAHLEQMLALSFIGNPAELQAQLQRFLDHYKPDELIAVSHIFEPADKKRSYEILSEVAVQLVNRESLSPSTK